MGLSRRFLAILLSLLCALTCLRTVVADEPASVFPTIDPADPYAYSREEQACIDVLKESFTRSMRLREHMDWLVRRGGMWTRRDDVLLFHACVPVEADGSALPPTWEEALDRLERADRAP